jgi:hypothetical protein
MTFKLRRGGLVGDTPQVVDLSNTPPPYTVLVAPQAGDVLLVETTLDKDGGGRWTAWGLGQVGDRAQDVFIGRLDALRFSRVSGAGASSAFEVLA